MNKASEIVLKAVHKYLKNVDGKLKIFTPCVIPILRVGGMLRLIPIFAALSALHCLDGAVGGITNAVQTGKATRKQLEEFIWNHIAKV